MIYLSVYVTPKAGRTKELESLVRDGWMKAMVEQPGFISGAVLRPFPEDELAKLQAFKPESAYEVVSFWRTEEERVAWVARPIHDQVFNPVIEVAESLSYTLHTVDESWNL